MIYGSVKVYFSLNRLTNQSKKADKQGSPKMKSFYSINFDYTALYGFFVFQKSKKFLLFEFHAYFSFKEVL